MVKNPGLIPGLGSFPGGGHGNRLQYSCLGNPMDRGTWQATVHGVTKSQLQLSNWACSWVNLTAYVTCPKSHKSNKDVLFWASLGLCCGPWAFSSCSTLGLLYLWHTGFLLQCQGCSCCGAWALEHAGSPVVARGFIALLWDLSSPTRDLTCIPCTGRRILNQWPTQ